MIGVECQYKHPTTFDDRVSIAVEAEAFKGVRLTIRYTMTNAATGEPVLTGRTMHCFTDAGGKPVILKKRFPELGQKLKQLVPEDMETQK